MVIENRAILRAKQPHHGLEAVPLPSNILSCGISSECGFLYLNQLGISPVFHRSPFFIPFPVLLREIVRRRSLTMRPTEPNGHLVSSISNAITTMDFAGPRLHQWGIKQLSTAAFSKLSIVPVTTSLCCCHSINCLYVKREPTTGFQNGVKPFLAILLKHIPSCLKFRKVCVINVSHVKWWNSFHNNRVSTLVPERLNAVRMSLSAYVFAHHVPELRR